MKFILKILFTPVIALLAIAVWISSLALKLSAGVLGIIGTLMGILGVLVLLTSSVTNGVVVLFLAFLISPIGLPLIGVWLIGMVQDLRYFIQSKVYG